MCPIRSNWIGGPSPSTVSERWSSARTTPSPSPSRRTAPVSSMFRPCSPPPRECWPIREFPHDRPQIPQSSAEPGNQGVLMTQTPVSYTHLRAHETRHDLVCRLLLEKKKKKKKI